MLAAIRSSLFATIAATTVVVVGANVARASWITIRNDTKQAVVVQEVLVVNGQAKRCKPVNLLPGETVREFVTGRTVKKIDVFDAHNQKRSLWSGKLSCKDESQTFAIVGSGGTVSVKPVGSTSKGPRAESK
jgi:hypothetical protein